PIGNLSRGPKTLTVTAYDVFGSMASVNVTFIHDNPPVITVTSPSDETVVRGSIHIVATCTDDDVSTGCQDFRVRLGTDDSAPFLAGSPDIDATPTLDPSVSVLTFTAKDSTGRAVAASRRVFVEDSPDLMAVTSWPGRVMDADGDRVAYRV